MGKVKWQRKEPDENITPDDLREIINDDVGIHLRQEFEDVAGDRVLQEEQWLKDLRQYKGLYDNEVLEEIPADKSRANIRLTRTKVRTMDARVFDLLFPAGGDKNFSVSETPVAEVSPEQKEKILTQIQQAMAAGQLPPDHEPSEEEIQKMVQDLAHIASEKMSEEMNDQLIEGKYQQVARDVMHSGHLFGTGVLKGVQVEMGKRKRWGKKEDSFELNDEDVRKPYFEALSIWDFYPDTSVTDADDCDFIWQRHLLPRHKVRKLIKNPSFNKKKIRNYLKAYPHGDADVRNHETELHAINDKQSGALDSHKRKYEVLERWGIMSGQELSDCGCDIDEEELELDFETNVWLLGDIVIKAVVNPTEQEQRPYHVYYFEKDETSIFGISIASIVRDPTQNFNAVFRAIMDNIGQTAGAIIEINQDLLADGETVDDILAFRVIVREGIGVEASHPAVRIYDLKNKTGEMMPLLQELKRLVDESSSIPSYMHGETDKGVGKTVGGLSMLMGAANITVKDVIKNYDEGITRPFISALYHWNMQFNPKEEIKGDYEVKALGSTSLIAKEIRAQQLDQFAASVRNPMDANWVKWGKLGRQRAKAYDLDDEEIIKTEDEYKADMQPPPGMTTDGQQQQAGGMQ